VYIHNTTTIMAKRYATSVRPWHAPKRRKTSQRQRVTLAQLPISVRPEVKFSDREIFATGSNQTLSLRPDAVFTYQGDDGDQMVGSECFLKAVDFSLELPTTGWGSCRVSVIVPRDPTVAAGALAPRFRYGHREFAVLYDELFSITERNHCRIKQKLSMKQKWNSTGTTITEGNALILINVDASVSIKAVARTYYTDP